MPIDPEENETGSPLKIGELLVKEGFVHPSDIDTALEIQQAEIADARLPVGRFLVKKGVISAAQLQGLLAHSTIRDGIGAWAVAAGLLDEASLKAFLLQKKPDTPLDEALVKGGMITFDQVRTYLRHQLDAPELGALAVRLHLVGDEELAAALRRKKNPRTIGEILCNRNLITPIDLNMVLAKYHKQLKLGDILIKRGVIDEAALAMAMEAQKRQADPIGKILRESGLADEKEIYEAFSVQHNLPFRSYEGLSFSAPLRAELTEIIGKDFASRFQILPVELNANRLTVAICHPESLQVLRALRTTRVDLRIHCTLVTDTEFQRLFHLLYGEGQPEMEPAPDPAVLADERQEASPPSAKAPPPASSAADDMIRFILNQALQWHAKTIHIDSDDGGGTLRFRIDGRLRNDPPPWFEKRFREIAGEVLCRIREMVGVSTDAPPNLWEGRGETAYRDAAEGVTVRVAFFAAGCFTLMGESATLTLEDPPLEPASPPPTELPPAVSTAFQQLLTGRPGLLLVSGEGGVHPLDTIRCVLEGVSLQAFKIILVSGSADQRLTGVMRVGAPLEGDPSRDSFFQTLLKLDPDLLIIDALEDESGVRFALEAGRSLRCIGILKAADAAQAIVRLRSLAGAAPDMTAERLLGVLATRPVKKLCALCKRPHQPSAAQWQTLFPAAPDHLRFYEAGPGCEDCGFTGYQGQVILCELIEVGGPLRESIGSGAPEPALRRLALRTGMHSLLKDGISRLDETSLAAIVEAVPADAARAFLESHGKPRLEPSETAVHTALICAPERQRETLIALHSAYERLMALRGIRATVSDERLFIAFIRDHFQRICREHRCRRVVFTLLDSPERPRLTATPIGP